MKEMDKETLVYEALLKLYFNASAKRFLDKEITGIMDRFVEYCYAKDIFDDTRTVETMRIIYDSKSNLSQKELKNRLAFSDSSLYRFRLKLIRSLQRYISDRSNI